MQIIQKINNSAALALDSSGNEIIVLGKGVGFPSVPYELEDMSRVERTFYDVDPKYLGMIAGLPPAILLASSEIAENAEIVLNCQLNPNLPFTLADHLNFAIERLKKGIDLTTPIAYDVQHLYPKEFELGMQALEVLQQHAAILLPDSEAVSVALHLINAEAEIGDLHEVMGRLKIISEVEKIVQKQLDFKLDKDSYNYSRFITHLRYLMQRLENGTPANREGAETLWSLARDYPEIYNCALKVSNYFKGTWDWQCSNEEIVYLMMHIHRVWERAE